MNFRWTVFASSVFIYTSTGSSSGNWIVFCDTMMSMSPKDYASLPALLSLFLRTTRHFPTQPIYYISTHSPSCSHNHENLFERRKLLNPYQTNIKTMKQLSIIQIKTAINRGMDWGFKTVFSWNRETMSSNHCQRSIFERAGEQMVLKTGYRQTDRQTKYIFTVWQTLSFQSMHISICNDKTYFSFCCTEYHIEFHSVT